VSLHRTRITGVRYFIARVSVERQARGEARRWEAGLPELLVGDAAGRFNAAEVARRNGRGGRFNLWPRLLLRVVAWIWAYGPSVLLHQLLLLTFRSWTTGTLPHSKIA
jgi:hypothetical protein